MNLVATDPAPSRLGTFQQQFAQALVAAAPPVDGDASLAELFAQPGFAVYRNTVHKGCIDALQANYPAVTRLVGEEWIRAAAAEFARLHRPASPMLLEYGAQFAAFLEGFAPAAELPYLAGVARLDRFWTEAHGARDELPLEPARVAALTQAELEFTRLRPHASARWAWFHEMPIFTLWSRNRHAEGAHDDIEWRGEGALVVRPFDSVSPVPLGRADVVFLDACAAGGTLADAAVAALAAEAEADLAQSMARLLSAGAFAYCDTERT
ncbi:MAG TPA: DNA-binding domain-containing protein [Burkholderiaceae bacterium]|nr:DNA-binding domain-containing protein [Burkholderiaceae bacterium]